MKKLILVIPVAGVFCLLFFHHQEKTIIPSPIRKIQPVSRVAVVKKSDPQPLKIVHEKAAPKVSKNDSQFLFDRATTELDNGEVDAAIDSLTEILSADPENAAALSELSLIYLDSKGDLESARHFMQEAVLAKPGDPSHLSMLLEIYRQDKREQDGLDFLKDHFNKSENGPEAAALIAQHIMQIESPRETATWMEAHELTASMPPGILSELGRAYFKKGDSAQAIVFQEIALQNLMRDRNSVASLDEDLASLLSEQITASRDWLAKVYKTFGE